VFLLVNLGLKNGRPLENGLLTAAKSGFTHLLLNPNTNPVISSHADVSHLLQSAAMQTTALYISAALSENGAGEQMASLYDLHKAGACSFGDFNTAQKNP
jgi:dihydroorotase